MYLMAIRSKEQDAVGKSSHILKEYFESYLNKFHHNEKCNRQNS